MTGAFDFCFVIPHRPPWGILKWPLSGSASVCQSVCPQLYLNNRLIDLIENVHSDDVYMEADARLIKCLARSDITDVHTFSIPNFIHIL